MTPNTPARGRQRLNRELIVEGAMSLIERQGPGALSMRRLGSELGVEGMAVYHYFAGRDQLLVAIAERLLKPLGELELDVHWDEGCERFAVALRQIAAARPANFQLLGMEPLDGQGALGSVERLLQSLVRDGFTASQALIVYRAVVSYARGYALAETAGFTVDAAGAAGRRRLELLPPGEFPVLAGRTAELALVDADRAFRLGLEALLTGFGTLAGGQTQRGGL